MAVEPGPAQVAGNWYSSTAEVLEVLSGVDLDLWPTTYAFEWMLSVVGIPMAANRLDALELLPSDTSPRRSAEGVSP